MNERLKASTSSASAGCQVAQLADRRDRRMEGVHVDPERVREDRVQDEEDRYPASERDQVGGDADRLVADLGQDELGLDVVEDPLERAEVGDGTADAPLLRPALARPIRPVHVAEMGHRVGRLDSAHLCLDRPGLAELGGEVRQAVRRRAPLPQEPSSLARGGHVRDLVSAPLELVADHAVELALVGHQRDQQRPHPGAYSACHARRGSAIPRRRRLSLGSHASHATRPLLRA